MIIKHPVLCDVICILCNDRRAVVAVTLFDDCVTINLVLCEHCVRRPDHEIVNELLSPRFKEVGNGNPEEN